MRPGSGRRAATGPAAAARPGRTRVVRAAALAGVAVLGAGGLAALATAPGYTQVRVGLVSGQAWVASSPRGEVALLDGSTDDVVTRVKVAAPGAALRLAQSGTDVVVADRSTGTVSRVSAALQAVVPGSAREAIPQARSGLSLVGGGTADAVYAIDSAQGLAVPVPGPRGESRPPVSLAASLDAVSTVVDRAGRFWAVEPGTGDVVRVDRGGTKHGWRGIASPGSRLVAAGDRVAVVDLARRDALLLGEDATVTRSACVDLRAGADADVAVGGSPDGGSVVVADSSRGVLLLSSFLTGDCSRAVSLRTGAHRLGAPVTVGTRVFVPDYTSGDVHIVDAGRSVLLASPHVLPGGGSPFELFPQDGVVFYNDPGGSRAGVIKIDGTFRAVSKYDEAGPAALVPQVGGTPSTQLKVRTAEKGAPAGAGRGAGRSGAGGVPRDRGGAPATAVGGRTVLPSAPGTTAGPLRITTTAPPYVAGQGVQLTAVPADGTGTVSDASWTFGDGTQGRGVGLTHTWSAPGTYRVCVTARIDGRRASAASDLLVVTPQSVGLPPAPDPAAGEPPVDPPVDGDPPSTPAATPTATPATSPAGVPPAVPAITGLTGGGDGRSVTVAVTYGAAGTGSYASAVISWGGGSQTVPPATGARSYTVTGLVPGTLTFTVKACNTASLCATSAARSVTLEAARTAPGTPTVRLASGNWTPGVLSYTVYLPSLGSGTLASVTVSWSGGASGSRTLAVAGIPVETTASLNPAPTGVDVVLVAKICNSDGLCAASLPTALRAYAQPVAPTISLSASGTTLTASYGAVPNAGSLIPQASGTVEIVDEAGAVAGRCTDIAPESAGTCRAAVPRGHTYQATYQVQTYPHYATSRSGPVTVP